MPDCTRTRRRWMGLDTVVITARRGLPLVLLLSSINNQTEKSTKAKAYESDRNYFE